MKSSDESFSTTQSHMREIRYKRTIVIKFAIYPKLFKRKGYSTCFNVTFKHDVKHPLSHALISTMNCVKRISQTKMNRSALQFASVVINTDPVPRPGELEVSEKYAILAEQGNKSQKIKS